MKNKGWAPLVLLQYLLETGVLEDFTIGEVIISLTRQTKAWLPKNRDISCAMIGKFTQRVKPLTHGLVIDEGELDFLVQDCINTGILGGPPEKCRSGLSLRIMKGINSIY